MRSSSSSTTAQSSSDHSEPQAMISRPVPHADNRDLKTFTFTHYIVLPGNLWKPWKAQPGAPSERQLTHNTNSPMSWNHNGLGIEYQQHSPMLQYPILFKNGSKKRIFLHQMTKHSKNAALSLFSTSCKSIRTALLKPAASSA